MEKEKQSTEPKVEVFAEKPGTAPANESQERTLPVADEKVEAEAEAKVEEQKQEAKTDALKKDDTSGEAG